MEKFCETLAITSQRVRQVVHRLVGEITAKHRPETLELNRDAGHARGIHHAGLELGAQLFEESVGISLGFRIYRIALTLTLSPRRGDSWRTSPGLRVSCRLLSGGRRFSLSHRMGAGRGEGGAG